MSTGAPWICFSAKRTTSTAHGPTQLHSCNPVPAPGARPDRRRAREHADQPRAAEVLDAGAEPLSSCICTRRSSRGSKGSFRCCRSRPSRALAEELQKLNNPPAYRAVPRSACRQRRRRSRTPARDWQIEFHPDADGELAPGDILIHSELMLPASADDLGAGQRTRRITTVHVGQRTTTREETVSRTAARRRPASHARLRYEDNAGPHIVRHRARLDRRSAAAASRIGPTCASMRRSMCRASTRGSAAIRRPARSSSSI